MKNMTEGHPLKLIFFFALPLMFGNILQQLYTMADTMIVGQFLGVSALASIGASDWLNWGYLGIVMGFTQGFSIRISHSYGANDFDAMKKNLMHIFGLCILIAVAITIIAHLTIHPILILLDTPDSMINGTLTYMRIIMSGICIVTAYNCFSSILRALGDSKTPLIAMIIASITNIVLDLVFIIYFKMGIAGAASATLIAQCLAVCLCAIVLFKQLPFKINLREFTLDMHIAKELMKIASPLRKPPPRLAKRQATLFG